MTANPAVESVSWNRLIPAASRVRLVVVAALFVAAYWHPLRQDLVGRWLHDANWSHGFLIPIFSAYCIVMQRDRLAACAIRPSVTGGVILALSLASYLFSAWWLRMAYPQALSMVGSLFGLVLLLGGWSVIRVTWYPILFLALAVPLPQEIYVDITMPLRRLASQIASAVMPLLAAGLHTEAQAVVIDYVMPGRGSGQLNVEEACSGMRSIMAFVTLGFAFAYWNERPVWQRLALLVLVIPIAVFCNAIRVTTTGLFIVHGRADLAQGTPHALLGMLLFAAALGLFSLAGYVVDHLFVEERSGAA